MADLTAGELAVERPAEGGSVQPGQAVRLVRKLVRSAVRHHPKIKRALVTAESRVGLVQHSIAQINPNMMRAQPRRLTIAITAHCNLRCIGCRYGRDFMPGAQLTLAKVKELLDDAKAGGVELVRLYGGEPLLHRDLPAMVRHAVDIGLSVYVTTNGILLKQRIDKLYAAGLRQLTIGYYGNDADYNAYVQSADKFRRLEEGVSTVRERYGAAVSLQLNYLIKKPSCNLGSLQEAWKFATKFDMTLHTDLIHYSLPYFTEGPDGELQFTEADRGQIEAVVQELERLKRQDPHRITDSLASIRSIPDWLLKKANMRVPCDAYQLLWVGADGTVQLCYATFELGNIHFKRLRDMLFTPAHHQAAKDAFALKCVNCHCERDSRIQKHLPSLLAYGGARSGNGARV